MIFFNLEHFFLNPLQGYSIGLKLKFQKGVPFFLCERVLNLKITISSDVFYHVSSDVNPSTNVQEMDSDNQEDDNLSCLENHLS